MFVNKIESDKGEVEIVYDIQWKTPGNDDDKAKIIGIVHTPDANLDWNTFKSYLIQNSGNMSITTNDIRISYFDSDDDLIPVDSELEFRECLKFSRISARKGRKIVMKVSMMSNGGCKPKDTKKYNDTVSKHVNPKLFCLKKKDMKDRILPKKSFTSQINDSAENNDDIPKWFERYMNKFKTELVDEITSAVISNVRTTLSNVPGASNISTSHSRNRNTTDFPQSNSTTSKGHHYHQLHHVIEKRKKKKKMPEEDSSDCTDGFQLQLEERLELLRHMQKVNKREKKFEKKLDAKLEKLESKTKKIIEKKHSLWNSKKPVYNSTQNVLPSSSVAGPLPSAVETCDLVMHATPVNEYNYVPHVLRGDLVQQVWQVMNDGQVSWSDETELRFAWGSKSLVPLTTVVKCPLLKPGETGKVNVSLQAPLFPGSFESYWHFHHQGRRFGHWLGCAVIVDPDPRPETPVCNSSESQPQNSAGLYNLDLGPLPVDLTMKCHQTMSSGYDNKISKTDDMKIYNIETKSDDEDKKNTDNKESEILIKETNVDVKNCSLEHFVKDQYIPEASTDLQTDSVPIDNNTSLKLMRSIIDTELEEFPKLESYASLNDPEISFMTESFPDLVQRSSDISDLKSWAKYVPNSAKNNMDIAVGDLLNIKDHTEILTESDQNVCIKNDVKDTNDKYEKILTDVKNMSLEDNITKENNDDSHNSADGEYVSGSDSDNISIISGTVSVESDDTEPSDEFVVVPMPTCVNCDTPEESQISNSVPVTMPISVEIPKSSSESDISAHAVQSDNNNNMELKPYPEMPAIYLPNFYAGVNTLQADNSESQEELKLEQKLSDDENTVYVRDASGKSIPVAKVVLSGKNLTDVNDSSSHNNQANVGFGVNSGIRHSTFGDPSFGQGPNGPRFPFTCGNSSSISPPHCHNPGGPCNFRPQHESPSSSASYSTSANVSFSSNDGCNQNSKKTGNETFCSHFCQNEKQTFTCSHDSFVEQTSQQEQVERPQCSFRAPPATFYPFDLMYQQQQLRGVNTIKTEANTYHNIHTEQPRACKYTYMYSNDSKENISSKNASGATNSSSRRSKSNSRETSPVAAAVQILPETLVTGAVNVASSAINTARSVIDMLRPRHDEPVISQWEQVSSTMENSLRMLSEMGFNNRELNIMLLSKHNNDVTRVISELVQ